MKFIHKFFGVYLTVKNAWASGSDHQESNHPKGATLKSITSQGSGCPEQATRLNHHEGLLFSTPLLFSVPKNITDSRKFCQFALSFDVDPNYQIALERISIQSYASLDENAKAIIAGSYYVSGQSNTVRQVRIMYR
jgi:Domain of unknown function (DUF4360)